jgi:hypothetical protein
VLGVLIVIHVGLTACSSNHTLTPEDYAIFNSLIHALFFDSITSSRYDLASEAEPQQIIVQSQIFGAEQASKDATQPRPPLPHRVDPSLKGFLLRELPGVEAALVQQFIVRNQKPTVVSDSFDVGVNVVLLTVDSLRAVFESEYDGWQAFYRHYPRSQGILELSRPAISDDRSRALVYAGNQYGYVEGSGWYFLLERDGERWVIVQGALSWVS